MTLRALSRGTMVAAAVLAAALAGADDRSTELFDYRCENELGRLAVTLFANGTVRVKEGPRDDETMTLGELGPERLAGYVARLAALDPTDLGEPAEDPPGLSGPWTERCTLRLSLADRPVEVHRFGRFDAPPLRVAQLVQIADDLAEETSAVTGPRPRLPDGYEPRSGDVLRDAAGRRFRVVDYTADERGLELDALDQPVRIVVAVEQLPELFVAVEADGR